MKEIELKAHVNDRSKVIELLNSTAEFLGTVEKSDTYYHIPADGGKKELSVRFRRQEATGRDGKRTEETVFTYKKKSFLTDENGIKTEVNEENECTLSGSEPLVRLIEELGAKISLRKHKSVLHWRAETDGFMAHLELCSVPPLGDFLEIEILLEQADDETAKRARSAEQKLFALCGIPPSQLESRYYSELLASAPGNS